MSFLTDFINKYNNQKVDFDGWYGHQCMDLANQYRKDLTGLNPNSGINLAYAYQVFDEPLGFMNTATKFEKIANAVDNCPIPGDIIVWSKEFNVWAGHIAIVTRADVNCFQVLEQNGGSGDGQGDDDNTKYKDYADYTAVAGWLRITEPNPNQQAEPQVQFHLQSEQQLNDWVNKYALARIKETGGRDYIGEIDKLSEQNSGLARQLGDSKTDLTNALDSKSKALIGKADAEEKTRQINTLLHETEIKLKNSDDKVTELKALGEDQKGQIERLGLILDGKQKTIIKQGEKLEYKPAVWNWTEFIKGLIKRTVTVDLMPIYSFIIAVLSSPELMSLLTSSKGGLAIIPMLPMIISFFKSQTNQK